MNTALNMTQSGLQPGVFWRGKLPSDWRLKRLKFAVRLVSAKTAYGESDLPYMGLEHIESWTGRYLEDEEASPDGVVSHFEPGDVLFGKLRPYLAKVHLARHRGVCSTEALVLRASEELLPEYLRYFLVAPVTIEHINSSTYGSKMPRASWDFIGNQLQPLPPLHQQQKIAAFLDRKTAEIDSLIARKRRLLELLAEKRTALITRAVTKGLDPDVPMKDSGIEWLGEIPAHWKVAPIKRDKKLLTSGSRGWASHYSDDGDLFLRIANLTRNSIRLNLLSIQHVMPPDGSEAERSKVQEGDVLFSITAYLGSAAVVPQGIGKAYVSQHLALFRLRQKMLMPEWVGLCAISGVGKDFLASRGYGGTKVQLSLDDVDQFVVPVPSIDEQKEIISFIEDEKGKILVSMEKIEQAIHRLEEYRSALITNAVTGQIKVA